MEEAWYRASRVCRILGNPIAFQILLALEREGPLTPGVLAQRVGRTVATVSLTLAKLRAIELVRYEAVGGRPRYRLKQGRETRRLLAALARFVRLAARLRGRQ
jgi:DNA-binding transcriptional ArsR family regulator